MVEARNHALIPHVILVDELNHQVDKQWSALLSLKVTKDSSLASLKNFFKGGRALTRAYLYSFYCFIRNFLDVGFRGDPKFRYRSPYLSLAHSVKEDWNVVRGQVNVDLNTFNVILNELLDI